MTCLIQIAGKSILTFLVKAIQGLGAIGRKLDRQKRIDFVTVCELK